MRLQNTSLMMWCADDKDKGGRHQQAVRQHDEGDGEDGGRAA